MKIAFSVRSIAAIQAPAKGRIYVYDTRQPGLCICITSTGLKTFYLYKKVHGKPQRLKLGRLGEISIEQARDRAAKEVANIAGGADPMAERRTARTQPTLGELCDAWMEKRAKPKKKSWREDERLQKAHLKVWKSRRLSTIKRNEVMSLHQEIGANHGHYTANRVLSLLRAMFNQAEALTGYQGANPAQRIERFNEVSRERYLKREELPAFFAALLDYPDDTLRDFFLVTLLTGARRSNVQSMRWVDLDLSRGIWSVSGLKAKGKLALEIVVPPPAVEILNSRREGGKESPWVFPGHKRGTHLKEPKGAWKVILKNAGIEDLRIHDLRRTLGSWQAMQGASLTIIGKSLGHSSLASTAVYARLGVEPIQDSVNKATAAIMLAGKPKEEGGEDE